MDMRRVSFWTTITFYSVMVGPLEAQVPNLAREPVPLNPDRWISMSDYPQAAVVSGLKGTATAALDIGEDGSVINCLIKESSGSKLLDDTTCLLLRRRAKYAPARNSEGNAMAAHTVRRVAWSLPEAPEVRMIGRDEHTLIVDKYDKVLSCSIFSGAEGSIDSPGECDFMKVALPTARRLSKLDGNVRLKALVETSSADSGKYNITPADTGDTVLREVIERYSVVPDGTVSNCQITTAGVPSSERIGFAPATPCTAGGRADASDRMRQETTAWRISISNSQ